MILWIHAQHRSAWDTSCHSAEVCSNCGHHNYGWNWATPQSCFILFMSQISASDTLSGSPEFVLRWISIWRARTSRAWHRVGRSSNTGVCNTRQWFSKIYEKEFSPFRFGALLVLRLLLGELYHVPDADGTRICYVSRKVRNLNFEWEAES